LYYISVTFRIPTVNFDENGDVVPIITQKYTARLSHIWTFIHVFRNELRAKVWVYLYFKSGTQRWAPQVTHPWTS